MRRHFLFLTTFLTYFALPSWAQEVVSDSTEVISTFTVSESRHDFGEVPAGTTVTHTFTLYNTGPDTLRISDVRGSCSCTKPKWSNAPLAAGDSTTIEVGFHATNDPARWGKFSKLILIRSDGTPAVKTLTLKGIVVAPPRRTVTSPIPLPEP